MNLETAKGKKGLFSLWFLIFIVSFSLIVFEISLTRLFSMILSYHFVFLAVSTAILGLGIGGMWGAKMISGPMNTLPVPLIIKMLLCLACCLPLTAAVLLWLPYNSHLITYGLIAMVPFVTGGALLAVVFSFARQYEWTHNIYFADLLGASIGSLLVIILIKTWGPFATSLLLGTIIATSALLLCFKTNVRKSLRLSAFAFIGMLMIIFFLVSNYPETELRLMSSTSSSKIMFDFLDNPEHEGEVVFTRWSIMARTDVVQTNLLNRKAVFTDGAAPSAMFRYSGNHEDIEELTKEVGFIPFTEGENDSVLTIGPGAGKDVLLAILADSKDITAVEINDGIVEAVRHFDSFSGGIYDMPQVEVVVDDGRSFIRRSSEKYDLIYLSLVVTDTADPTGYSLIENYIYTMEAFHNYLDRLEHDGRLAFIFHDQNDLLRGLTTTLKVLEERGIPSHEGVNHLAMINGTDVLEGVIRQPLLLVKNEPFTESSANNLLNNAVEVNLQPLYIPFSFEEGVTASIGSGSLSVTEFIDLAPLNIEPTTDNKPFFYNLDKGTPSYLLALLAITLAVTILILLLVAIQWRKQSEDKSSFLPFVVYFSSLGIGFMIVEIPLILKLSFFLGRPTVAISITLFSLLAAGGMGSALGVKLFHEPVQRARSILILIISALIIYLLFLPGVLENYQLLPINSRVLITVIILFPIGFLMGIPFPTGLSLISKGYPRHVSLMWGINGLTSVIGSVLAIIFSLAFGFQLTLLSGILFYSAAFAVVFFIGVSRQKKPAI